MSDHHPFDEDSHEFIIGPVKKTNGSGPPNGALSTTWDAYIVREDDDIDEPEVEKPAPATVMDDGIEKRLVTIDTLNSEYALLEVPGVSAAIIRHTEAKPISDKEFRLRIADHVVQVEIQQKNGNVKKEYVAAATLWIKHTNKKRYRRMAFTSKPVDADTLNLFTGFGVKPKRGRCELIKKHVREVICCEDDNMYACMQKLIAWQVQNIGTPSRVIVDLISPKEQTGKGFFLEGVLLPIYGNSGFMTFDLEHVTGTHNDAIAGKALVVLDEAMFAGDKKGAAKIKSLAATNVLPIHAKYMPVISMPGALNFWSMSNEALPMHVGEQDARHLVLHVSDKYAALTKENKEYWNALGAEIKAGGPAAYLYELLRIDLDGFNPQHNVPRASAAHDDLAMRSLNPGDPRNWLLECITSEEFVGTVEPKLVWDENTDKISPSALFNGYKEWVKGLRGVNIKTTNVSDFWDLLTKAGFTEAQRTGTGCRRRNAPTQEACKQWVFASVRR